MRLFPRLSAVLPAVLPLAVYLTGCSSVSQDTAPVGCVSDSDCEENQFCRNKVCTGTVPDDFKPETPEETYNSFVRALQSNDLEQVLVYIHPRSRQIYESILSGNASLPPEFKGLSFGESMSSLAQKLEGASLRLESEFGDLRDYSYDCRDSSGNAYRCLIRFKQDENDWKIKNF